MSVVSISMPEGLQERIDEFADEHGYSGRSEVVREATRSLLEEFQGHGGDGQAYLCTVTVLFEYRQSTVQRRLTELRHEYDTLVSATTHAHVGNRYCMELFVLYGPTEAIAAFVNAVRAVSDVRMVDYSVATPGATSLNQVLRS